MARNFDIPSRVVPLANRLIPRYFIEPEPSDDPIPDYLSMLGTPVYANLQFLKTSGTSADNSLGVGEQNGNSEVLLTIDTVMMNVNQSKNIVRTPIAGRDGTVKEYISDGDFDISISGRLVTPYANVYPREEVNILFELLSLKKQIPVASDFLLLFNIDSIVVLNYTITEVEGSRNQVEFSINALSDKAEEIILNPNNNL
jgi:hypothetical protein